MMDRPYKRPWLPRAKSALTLGPSEGSFLGEVG